MWWRRVAKHIPKACVLLVQFLLLVCWTWNLSWVQAQENDATQGKKSLAKIAQDREQLANRLATLESKQKDSNDEAVAESLQQEVRRVKNLDALLLQRQARIERLQEVKVNLDEAHKELERLDSYEPDSPKPYSFLLLDSLKDGLDLDELKAKEIQAEIDSTQLLTNSAKSEVSTRERAVESLKSPNDSKSTAELLDKAIDDVAIAKAKYELRRTDLEILKLQKDLNKMLQKQVDKKIDAIRKNVRFTSEDRDKKLRQLDDAATEWRVERSAIDSQLGKLHEQTLTLESEGDTSSDQHQQAIVRGITESLQRQNALVDQVIDSLQTAKTLWKARYSLSSEKEHSLKSLRDTRSDLKDFLNQLDSLKANVVSKYEQRARMYRERAAQSSTAGEAAEALVENEHQADRSFEILVAKLRDQVEALQFPMVRFHSELKERIKSASSIWQMGVIEFINSLLSYEVTEVDEEPITIWHAVFLVLLILLGVYVSFLASRFVATFVFPRLGIKPGVGVALRSIFRYVLCIVFGVIAFRLMNIPLTAFAFLGGAAAIAVGFGSQDVMNNFMSGLILLTEQPIRVGDVILLNDNQCLVTHIGLRSTRLRNYQKHELIVPNTLLIEKLVTNLTLSDNLVRLVVSLEVDRTEPVVESMQKISQTLKETGLIHKESEPVVLLKGADTYYLTFEVHFTIEFTDPMESLIAQSRILEAISVHFPSPAVSAANNGGTSSEETTPTVAATAPQPDARKLDKVQLEREVKRLRAQLASKPQ